MELTANCHTGEVTIKQVGPNSSALDGIELIQNKEYKMKPSATLFILTGLYPQRLKIVDTRKAEGTSEIKLNKTHKTHNGDVTSKSGSHKDKEIGKVHKSDSSRRKHSDASKEKDRSKDKDRGVGQDKKHTSSHGSSKSGSDKTKEESVKSGFKRPSTPSDSDRAAKKPKLSEKDDHGHHKSHKGKTVRFNDSSDNHPVNSDGEECIKDVAEKLKALKESAKKQKTSEKVTDSPSSRESTVSKSFWEKIESMYMYRSKGLKSSSKVNLLTPVLQ